MFCFVAFIDFLSSIFILFALIMPILTLSFACFVITRASGTDFFKNYVLDIFPLKLVSIYRVTSAWLMGSTDQDNSFLFCTECDLHYHNASLNNYVPA